MVLALLITPPCFVILVNLAIISITKPNAFLALIAAKYALVLIAAHNVWKNTFSILHQVYASHALNQIALLVAMALHAQAVLWAILSIIRLELVNCVVKGVISVQE